jgi:ParB-like partition proteins
MSKSFEGKIKLSTYSELVGDTCDEIIEVELSELHDFTGHPFRVVEDERMQEMVESVRKHGVLVPGIVRHRKDGEYEIISGHRRKMACELAGLETMPVIVKEYPDDQAVITMVDSNIQREDILPSEKARAYRMKYEAMKHPGTRTGGLSLDLLGEAAGESSKTVQRYLWLSRLTDDMMDLLDRKRVTILCGIDISFLNEEEQDWVYEAITIDRMTVNQEKTKKLKDCSGRRQLSRDLVRLILSEQKSKPRRYVMRPEVMEEFFGENDSVDVIEEVVEALLRGWKKGSFTI